MTVPDDNEALPIAAPEGASLKALPSWREQTLIGRLRRAKANFVPNQPAGRVGAAQALQAVLEFIICIPEVRREDLHIPLGHLFSAMKELGNGTTNPLLAGDQKSGRAKDGLARCVLKGTIAFWVDLDSKYEEGIKKAVRQAAACAKAAEVLNSAGQRPARGGGPFTVRTVRGWCAAVAEDVGAATIEGKTFRVYADNLTCRVSDQRSNAENRAALSDLLKELMGDLGYKIST